MKILILEGASGSGKTTSLRNLDPNETIIIAPNDKELPWPGWKKQGWHKRIVKTDDLAKIKKTIKLVAETRPDVKQIIIEDFTHAQTAVTRSEQFMAAGKSKNPYTRWEEFGVSVHNAVFSLTGLRDDLTVIVINHTDQDGTGYASFKTFGKMVGNSTMPTSYCTIVLHSIVLPDKPIDQRYVFVTNDDGLHEAKSPMGMFDQEYIPNDLAPVLKRIQEYANENA